MFLVGVCETRFPTNRSRTLWTSVAGDAAGARCAATPATCRSSRAHDKAALDAYRGGHPRAHDAEEELRLGYVAFTRGRAPPGRVVVPSGARAATPFGPVGLPAGGPRAARRLGRAGRAVARQAAEGRPQPVRRRRPLPPVADPPAPGARRRCASRRRGLSARRTRREPDAGLDMVEAAPGRRVGRRARPAAGRGARATAAATSTCRCPPSLSATALARLRDDPDAFARELARPMPRPPSSAARFGTRFHAWVEARFGQQDAASTPTTCPAAATPGIDDDADLQELVERFEDGPFADRVPHAVEAPVRAGARRPGRPGPDRRGLRRAATAGSLLVVDWKTNREPRPPTRSSSRSTGWPGPSSPASRSTRSGPRSTTSAPATSSSRPACPTAELSASSVEGLPAFSGLGASSEPGRSVGLVALRGQARRRRRSSRGGPLTSAARSPPAASSACDLARRSSRSAPWSPRR